MTFGAITIFEFALTNTIFVPEKACENGLFSWKDSHGTIHELTTWQRVKTFGLTFFTATEVAGHLHLTFFVNPVVTTAVALLVAVVAFTIIVNSYIRHEVKKYVNVLDAQLLVCTNENKALQIINEREFVIPYKPDGLNPYIHAAIQNDFVDVIKRLTRKTALKDLKIDEFSQKLGLTTLSKAIESKAYKTIQYMVESGYIDELIKKGKITQSDLDSCLEIVAPEKSTSLKTIQKLVLAGANPFLNDKKLITPNFFAIAGDIIACLNNGKLMQQIKNHFHEKQAQIAAAEAALGANSDGFKLYLLSLLKDYNERCVVVFDQKFPNAKKEAARFLSRELLSQLED